MLKTVEEKYVDGIPPHAAPSAQSSSVFSVVSHNTMQAMTHSEKLALFRQGHILETDRPITPLKFDNVFVFLRILFAFCFAKPETLGWDPSMILDPVTKELLAISVTGCEYNSNVTVTRTFKVVKELHSSAILYGRGTRVWIVKDEQGRFFVLKDSWTLADKRGSEIEFVQNIERIILEDEDGYLFQYNCPTYCIGQELVWTTRTIRSQVEKRSIRNQRRIVTGPIGDPITSFRSKREFVSVMLDIVNCKFSLL